METDKTVNIFTILKNIWHSYRNYLGDFLKLIKLETELAIESAITLIILLLISLLLLITCWTSLLACLFCLLITFHLHFLFAAIIVTLCNFILLAGILYAMSRTKRNLFFRATRRQIASVLRPKEDQNEPLKMSNSTNGN